MGKLWFDQYSLLHLASGVIAYFYHIPLRYWIIIHLIFEILENTSTGIWFINTWLTFWPGGKPYPDSLVNSISDNAFSTLGWLAAQYLDNLYSRK